LRGPERKRRQIGIAVKRLETIDRVNYDKVIVVLAEGIETKEEYDFFQGYYLGRPS